MQLAYDILSGDDRQLLQEFARRMGPHVTEVTSEWVEAVERALTPPGADRDAYRQMLTFFIETSLRTYVERVSVGDFEGMYEFQYRTNREGAAASLGNGAMPLYDPGDIHLTMRVASPVVRRWINLLFAEDPQCALRTTVAQERFGGQLAMVLSEAYAHAREARLHDLGAELGRALDVSERLRSLGQAIVRSLDMEPVLDLALRTAVQLLRADGAAIYLPNREGTTLQLRRLVGGDPADHGRTVAVADSLSGWVYQMNQAVKSVRALPEERRTRVAEALRARGVQAVLVVPLRAGGKPIGALGVNCRVKRRFADADELLLQSLADYVAIALENARIHAEVRAALREMERLNRAKSEFVAAVSHEIRAPLSSVVGYVQILREGGFGPITPEQHETLDRLESIAQSTVQLTNDLLEQARADAGALPVHLEAVRLAPLFDELGETVRVMLGQRPIRFAAHLLPGAEGVRADPVRLRQVLSNLLTNAAKFTEQGSITLTAARATDGSRAELTVRDTGIGIDPQDLPRIFDLFYRANRHATLPGVGIGLFLSRQLATLMGGELTVESRPGAGSTFILSLPIAR